MKILPAIFYRTLPIILLISCSSGSLAATYYFSSTSGDDARSAIQAQNPGTPWRSLQQLHAVMAAIRPGDSILFKRGDEFRGSIVLHRSGKAALPIVFGAYGSGDKPVISGFDNLNNWTLIEKGIWESKAGNALLNVLLLNGEVQQRGRFPNVGTSNNGYLQLTGFSGTNSITGIGLQPLPDWTGGEVVIRKNHWVLDRNTITGQSGNTLNYTSETSYPPSLHFGFFIQDHPQTLDLQGEWYYDKSSKKVKVFFGAADPATFHARAAVIDTIVLIRNQKYIVFSNIRLEGANSHTFEISAADHIRIADCDIRFSGINAINASHSRNINIENCTIEYTGNIAFNGADCSNTVLRNNLICNTGTIAGMGKGNSGSYEAILLNGNNNLVEFNMIDSTGYIPITFSGNDVVIKNNFINHFGFIKDDGAGIYTWNNSENAPRHTNRIIEGNIILNGLGAGAGTDNPGKSQMNGIYIDDNADHVILRNNTIAACGQYGIYIHNAHEVDIVNNTTFNNRSQLAMVHDGIAPKSAIVNCTLNGNILFSLQPTATVAEFRTPDNTINGFGTFDSNYYCRPLDDYLTIQAGYRINKSNINKSYDLSGWQNTFHQDIHSRRSPVGIRSYRVTKTIGANKFDNGKFDQDISGLYCYSPDKNCKLSWMNGGIDAGTLKLDFRNPRNPPPKASVVLHIGKVTAGKKYLLKFRMFGTVATQPVEVFLRKSLAGYADLSERKFTGIDRSDTKKEMLLTATATENNASLVLSTEEQQGSIYLDDIELVEAESKLTNPDDSIRFVYNASNATSYFNLEGTFRDVKGIIYQGSIALTPYSSAILIRVSAETTPIRKKFVKNGPRTMDDGPRTTDHGPQITDHRPWTTDHGPWTMDIEHRHSLLFLKFKK